MGSYEYPRSLYLRDIYQCHSLSEITRTLIFPCLIHLYNVGLEILYLL